MSRQQTNNRRWSICGLILLATMLNYMDRQTLSQSATDIGRELRLSNEDYGRLEQGFGLAFALGGVVLGFVADRVSLRWLYPVVLLAWSATGFATAWAEGFGGLLACRVLLGFFEAGQWPCALAASQRLLSQRDRALGNSVIQSGASIGAILTPLVVQAMVTDAPGTWRGPFRVIGLLGAGWTAVWLLAIRPGDLDRVEPGSSQLPEVTTTSRAMFVRRFLVLVVVVVAINLCWHFYRAWLPKMLREQYHFSRTSANLFTSLYYIATDAGCLGAGLAVRALSTRGWPVHRARAVTFLVCGLLTALGAATTSLPPGSATLGLFLLVGAGSLGLFPVYYSLTQELSARHQGKVTGSLGCIAWLSSALMHGQVGRWVDRTGSYGAVLVVNGMLPLAALVALALFWDRPAAAPARPLEPAAGPVPAGPSESV